MAEKQTNRYAELVLACSENQYYSGEKVLEDHALVRVVSGELKVIQADQTYTLGAGDTLLFARNQLSTLIKSAKDGRPYKSIVIVLATDQLRTYYAKNTFAPLRPADHRSLSFEKNLLLDSFFASVLPYFELERQLPEKILEVKIQEAIEILRSITPNVDPILADFSEPGKINLADFMEKNYMFNISLTQFSTLTGRSLTTFKRDFRKAFHTTPQRWLIQKRLELAHYQLSNKKRTPTEIYYEAGFENLSHFSRAFKNRFGYPPTALIQKDSAV